jgi:hypothetical protein
MRDRDPVCLFDSSSGNSSTIWLISKHMMFRHLPKFKIWRQRGSEIHSKLCTRSVDCRTKHLCGRFRSQFNVGNRAPLTDGISPCKYTPYLLLAWDLLSPPSSQAKPHLTSQRADMTSEVVFSCSKFSTTDTVCFSVC